MRRQERESGYVRFKLIWDWKRRGPVRLRGGPELQLNWTQKLVPSRGRNSSGKAGRKDPGMRLGRREF